MPILFADSEASLVWPHIRQIIMHELLEHLRGLSAPEVSSLQYWSLVPRSSIEETCFCVDN